MTLKTVLGDVVVPTAPRTVGTYPSGPIANPGVASHIMVFTHTTTYTGAATFDVSIQTSPDGSTWTTIGSIAQQSAAGSAALNVTVNDDYVQVLVTIGGVGTVPCRVVALVI